MNANYSVLICGKHCDNDVAISNILDIYSISNVICRHVSSDFTFVERPASKNIMSYANAREFNLIVKKIKPKVIVSIGGGLVSASSIKVDIFGLDNKPLIIELACGADISEIDQRRTMFDARYRRHLKKADVVYVPPYPEILKRLSYIRNWIIAKPFFYDLSKHNVDQEKVSGNTFTFLHCSNLDWGVTDYKLGRNTTKGNDRFLNAFMHALRQNMQLHCHILDRGPDRLLAKEFIKSNGLDDNFTWHKSLSRQELHALMIDADIIVDQFDVGGLGGIACEAMALAKPVMIHIDENCWPLAYSDAPPVINCTTEDQIFQSIKTWCDKGKLKSLGIRAEHWVRKQHDQMHADYSEFILRVCTAADLSWPRARSSSE